MILRSTVAMVTMLLVLVLPAGFVSAQSQPAAKLQAKVRKIGIGKEITVTTPHAIYHGLVERIGDDGFSVDEIDLHKTVEVKYNDVTKVDHGYGHQFDRYGQRIPPRKQNHWGWVLGIAALVLPITLVAVALHDDY